MSKRGSFYWSTDIPWFLASLSLAGPPGSLLNLHPVTIAQEGRGAHAMAASNGASAVMRSRASAA